MKDIEIAEKHLEEARWWCEACELRSWQRLRPGCWSYEHRLQRWAPPRRSEYNQVKLVWLVHLRQRLCSLLLKATHIYIYIYKYIFTQTHVYIYMYTHVIQYTVCIQSFWKRLCTTKPALCIENSAQLQNFHCVNLHIPDLKQIQSHMVQFPLALNWHHWSVRLVGHTVLICWYMLICFKCLDEAWIPNQLCLILA